MQGYIMTSNSPDPRDEVMRTYEYQPCDGCGNTDDLEFWDYGYDEHEIILRCPICGEFQTVNV